MDEVMDVPPLEDMSDILQKVLKMKDTKSSSSLPDQSSALSVKKPTTVINELPQSGEQVLEQTCKDYKSNQAKAKEGGFGGMKKGFLFASKAGSSSEKSSDKLTVEAKTQCDSQDVPFIRENKESSESKYQFSEVQQAMNISNSLSLNKDWLSDDLLHRIQSCPDLLTRLADPTFMTAITEFQSNPQAAMHKYRDNAAIQSFLKEFCGLLGDHFSSLDSQQTEPSVDNTSSSQVRLHSPDVTADMTVVSSKSTSQGNQRRPCDDGEEARVKDILADPEMRNILMDSRIQRLLEALRTDPDKAQMIITSADMELKLKIGRLVQAGLLQFQT